MEQAWGIGMVMRTMASVRADLAATLDLLDAVKP